MKPLCGLFSNKSLSSPFAPAKLSFLHLQLKRVLTNQFLAPECGQLGRSLYAFVLDNRRHSLLTAFTTCNPLTDLNKQSAPFPCVHLSLLHNMERGMRVRKQGAKKTQPQAAELDDKRVPHRLTFIARAKQSFPLWHRHLTKRSSSFQEEASF